MLAKYLFICYTISVKRLNERRQEMDRLATQLLNVFGYLNAKEEDVIVLDSSFNHIQVEFFKQIFYFTRENNTWTMELE